MTELKTNNISEIKDNNKKDAFLGIDVGSDD